MSNVNLKKEISLAVLAICITAIAVVGYNYFESKRIEKIDASIDQMTKELLDNNQKRLSESIETIEQIEKSLDEIGKQSDKILKETEEETGPTRCATCKWPQSYRAKFCTNCGAPND